MYAYVVGTRIIRGRIIITRVLVFLLHLLIPGWVGQSRSEFMSITESLVLLIQNTSANTWLGRSEQVRVHEYNSELRIVECICVSMSNNNNNNKRPLTPKSMPPVGDEHAKLKT